MSTAIPAAQYVRMSDEDQQYSLENQKAAIAAYATQNGFEIVATYQDAGRSGVVIKNRGGLNSLLGDVIAGRAKYSAILTYDVSRWGRFQDEDEAGFYEFLCKRAGIRIHYCAEPFRNDGSPSSSIMKALKRSMAAEYSRELGVKVVAGQARLVRMGFKMGGSAGYGLRRVAISTDGRRRTVLAYREQKAVNTDRVILVPGPPKEVRWVRQIFNLAAKGMQFWEIAEYLNERHVKNMYGQAWCSHLVYNLVTNPKYVGCNRWGVLTSRLHTKRVKTSRDCWITKPQAFTSLIDQKLFDKVQRVIRKRATQPSEKLLLSKLKRLLARKGRLSSRIIDKAAGPNMPTSTTYQKRFGSVMRAYQLIGYTPPLRSFKCAYHLMRSKRYLKGLTNQICAAFPDRVSIRKLTRKHVFTLMVDNEIEVSMIPAVPMHNEHGNLIWQLHVRPQHRDLVTLVYRLTPSFDGAENIYLLPFVPPNISRSHRLNRYDPIMAEGERLFDLDQFCVLVRRMDEIRRRWLEKRSSICPSEALLGAAANSPSGTSSR